MMASHGSNPDVFLIPLQGVVLGPGAITPVLLSRPGCLLAVADHVDRGQPLVCVLQRGAEVVEAADVHLVGCRARVLRTLSLGDGSARVLLEGLERVRIMSLRGDHLSGWKAETEPLLTPEQDAARSLALEELLRKQLSRLLGQDHRRPNELASAPEVADGPERLASYATGMLELPPELQQALLQEPSLEARLEMLALEAAKAWHLVELSNSIQARVEHSLDRRQREWVLREQIRACREELGEHDGPEDLLRERIEVAGLPPEARREALRELDRLAAMPPDSTEVSLLRGWLEWLAALPWQVTTIDDQDLQRARDILDADHHGLDGAKDRILEHLAVRQLNPDAGGATLCFVGPPGTGKTSLAQTTAAALGRGCERVALGGVRDEAEVRGHRRTYVGAMPGRILRAIRRAGTRNPVIVLDELDKLSGERGDPAAALLEVLDPSQNHTFEDHYLDLPFDLSDVLFVATANVEEHIPSALRDRLEVVHLPGYLDEDKIEIAQRHLVPRLARTHGLSEQKLRISTAALKDLVERYAREPGVRQLERLLARVYRGMARKFVEGRTRSLVIKPKHLRELLGPPPHSVSPAERVSSPGVAVGLAWTATGGELLMVESAGFEGSGLKLTGSVGNVLRESAETALAAVRAHLHLDPFGQELHVHLPHAGIPKDGPSAGLPIALALASLLSGESLGPVAMSGEVTLSGRILPVGGLREKLLAARRAGIQRVLLPAGNEEEVRAIGRVADSLTLHFVATLKEAWAAAR